MEQNKMDAVIHLCFNGSLEEFIKLVKLGG